jgi:hypothetical protein
MTLRERMKKRITRAALYTTVVGTGAAAGLVRYPWGWMLAILVGWGFITIAVVLILQWFTRCPNCRAMLGANGRAVTKDNPTLDNCPQCGVNFDQPMESVANTK